MCPESTTNPYTVDSARGIGDSLEKKSWQVINKE
jgi:hypothetical protein